MDKNMNLCKIIYYIYYTLLIIYTGLEEAQGGIKIAGRNINNLRYADDTTLMEDVKRN